LHSRAARCSKQRLFGVPVQRACQLLRDALQPMRLVQQRAQLLLVQNPSQRGHERLQRLLAVFLKEERRVVEPRDQHPFVALAHLVGVAVVVDRNKVRQ
jgi:hypothetical protein